MTNELKNPYSLYPTFHFIKTTLYFTHTNPIKLPFPLLSFPYFIPYPLFTLSYALYPYILILYPLYTFCTKTAF